MAKRGGVAPAPAAAKKSILQACHEGGPEAWLAAVLWHHRHNQGNALAVRVTDADLEQMEASTTYTKQAPAVDAVIRGRALMIAVVEADTRIEKDGTVISMGNEIRPCESDPEAHRRGELAAAKASRGQRARELASQILGAVAADTMSAELMREAANLLQQVAGSE